MKQIMFLDLDAQICGLGPAVVREEVIIWGELLSEAKKSTKSKDSSRISGDHMEREPLKPEAEAS